MRSIVFMRIAFLIIVVALGIGLAVTFVRIIVSGVGGGDAGKPFGAGSDGGIYVSLDGGETFTQHAKAGNADFSRFDILDVKEDPERPERWWVATDGAGLYRSDDNAETWTTVGGGLAKATVRSVALGGASTILIGVDSGGRGRVWKSLDEGVTFRETYPAAKSGVFVNTLAIARQNTAQVLAGLSDGLLLGSSDGGESWTKLTQFPGPVSLLRIAPSDPSVVYAIISGRGIARSYDYGQTWDDLSQYFAVGNTDASGQSLAQISGGRDVFSLAVKPNDAQYLLAATSGGLLRSSDGGSHFEELKAPWLPKPGLIRTAAFAYTNTETIYVTAGDIFGVSFDGGVNFRPVTLSISPKLNIIAPSVLDSRLIVLGTGK